MTFLSFWRRSKCSFGTFVDGMSKPCSLWRLPQSDETYDKYHALSWFILVSTDVSQLMISHIFFSMLDFHIFPLPASCLGGPAPGAVQLQSLRVFPAPGGAIYFFCLDSGGWSLSIIVHP